MDDVSDGWVKAYDALLADILDIPTYRRIGEVLSHGIQDSPNILLYGAKGFPHSVLWDAVARNEFGNFTRRPCVFRAQTTGNQEWHYQETPYFFDIDLQNPSQPKDLQTLSDFLTSILRHPCMHTSRHIFLLRNIDAVMTKDGSPMFRVLLERFSKNAWFICTTYKVASVECPIRSRFLAMRVPLMTPEEVCHVLVAAGKDSTLLPELHECIRAAAVRDIRYALYLAEYETIYKSMTPDASLPHTLEVMANYKAPFLHTSFNTHRVKDATFQEIRALAQKLTVNGYTLADVVRDVLSNNHIASEAAAHEFVRTAAELEHKFACTDGYRKSLYLEYLLHRAFFPN